MMLEFAMTGTFRNSETNICNYRSWQFYDFAVSCFGLLEVLLLDSQYVYSMGVNPFTQHECCNESRGG